MSVISYDDYIKNKKKKKKDEEDIAPIRSNNGVMSITDLAKANNLDIKEIDKAVKSTIEEKEKNKRTWFSGGAFSDGYDFGDVSKTILGTTADVGVNAVRGVAQAGEGIGKLLVGGVAEVSDWVGADNYADKLRNRLAGKDEKINRRLEKTTISPWLNKASDFLDDYSLIGEKSDDLTSSVGNLGAAASAQMVGVPWWVTMGGSSAGQELENAYKNDATSGEAWASAAISGASEILFERLSGGISFGGRTLDEGAKKLLSDAITNKTAQTLAKFGLDMVGEGTEEVLTEITSNIGRKLTYEDDKTLKEALFSEEALDNYLEAFIGGAVIGGGFNLGRLNNSLKTGRDYDTNLTQNEQLVISKEVENRVTELKNSGEKVTNKDKVKIEEQVRNELEKGYVSTDSIESTLGGDTYNQLKSLRDNKTSIESEIKQLENKPYAELTVKEKERLDSIREELKTIDTNTLESKLQSEMGTRIASDGLLQRSYQEKANKSVKFEADLSKYDAKQQEVVQKAIDSGVLNNTNRTHDFVDMVAKISSDKGISFDFTNNENLKNSGFAIEGKAVNGYIKDGNITLNIDSNKALNRVVGHEVTHVLEGTDLYTELQQVVKEYATTKGEYDTRLNELTELYKNVDNTNVENELTADLVGDYLFTDTDFINNLSTQKPNLFKKIYNEIKHLYKLATAGSKEARQLEKVKKAFEEAYKQNASNTSESNAEYSVKDNQGRELTTEQQEFFKDSKVKDENGNLLAVYHGTRTDFNVFDNNKAGDNYEGWTHSGKGFYFTDSKTEAQEFGDYSLGEADTQIKEVYLNITNPFETTENYTTELAELGKEYNIEDYYLERGDRLLSWFRQNKIDATEALKKYGFDGVIDHGHYLVYEANQIKNVDNTKPTTSEDMRYSLSEDSNIKDVSTGYGSGEYFYEMQYTQDGKVVGTLNYGVYEGQPNVKMIEVDPEYQRKGIGTKLLQELQKKYDGIEIDFGMSTPDGTKLLENITYTVENKEVADKLARIDEIQKKLEEYDKGYENYFDNDLPIPENYAEDYNDLHDEMVRLQQETRGKSATKTFVKTDNIKYSLTDNQGRTLTKEQQEYFKDSKVRDEEGRLLEVYHGTPYGEFTVFDSNHESNVGMNILGEGFYFTSLESTADEYSRFYDEFDGSLDYVENSKVYKTYLNIKNPFVYNASEETLKDALGKVGINYNKKTIKTDLMKKGYDGIIEHTRYSDFNQIVAYYSNQIKNIDNTNPTSDEDIRYSLGNQDIAPSRNDIFGSDIKLQVEEAIAPIQEQLETVTKELTDLRENTAPAPQNIVEQEAGENLQFITDDLAPVVENATPDYEYENDNNGTQSTARSPFYDRDYGEVGKRNVKAYQYEHPEVRPYFQEEARMMLDELNTSVKGERFIIGDISQVGNGNYEYSGTKRFTTDSIAQLLDGVNGKYKLTYEDIRNGLDAIIEDNGKENVAAAKRIEFILDDRLTNGYTTIDGYEVPANQGYISTLEGIKMSEDFSNIPIEEDPDYYDASNTQEIEEIAPTRSDIDWDSVEDTSKGKQVKYNEETQTFEEEDLVKKTKRELRQSLLGTEAQKEFITSALDNAKNRSMALMNNTDTIRNTELVFGRDAANVINEKIFQKEIDNEADSIKWQNEQRQEIKDLGIKARSKESAAVQKYGEKQWVNDAGEVVAYGDAELASEFSDVETQNKIKNAAKEIRKKYDDYIDRANGVLTKLGFDPIKKRADYMRHFQELTDVFSRHGIPFNAQNMAEHTLPTDINGLTEFWSPQKNYFANMQARKGMKTTYDAITGIDGYISGISNLIFHTEDIQRGRAFEELIRETYGEDKGWDNLENLPDELKQLRAEKIQDNHLSNYAAWVHEWTNNVAGKKSKIDRSVEAMFGRKAFAFLDQSRKQVGSNLIGMNISSSLTNLIAPTKALAKTKNLAFAKGTADTIKNIFIKDNFMDKNRFLTSRMGTDMISKNAWQKVQDAGYVFMKGIDWFSSNQIVRSKYYELRAKGMNEQQAHAEAGKFAARIMGDRTKGANAQLYNSKLLGLVTQFQLEVNNDLYSTFYDTYHESKENAKGNALKMAAGMTFTLGQLFAYTHLFSKAFEAIAGYTPTLDVLEILKTALGWDDEEDEKTTSERLKSAADQLVDGLPYVNILTGGGRIPVASAIPNLVGVATGGKDEYGNELKLDDELKKLLFLIPPTGGNQIKKTTQGLSMFDDELPVTGSYTDSGNLRFPVEETPLNVLQAGLFGQWASKNAGKYFDEERAPLKSKQIQEYADLDMPIADYWEYRDGLKEQNTIQEKFDYINSLDVTDEQKNIMINNAVDRKEDIDLSNYDDFGSYDEFDYATKNPDKYRVIEQIDTYDKYVSYKDDIASIKEQFSNENGYSTKERKAAVQQYIQSLNLDIPQKIMLEKMAGGYSVKPYRSYLYSYIESLPLTAEEKQAIDDQLFN